MEDTIATYNMGEAAAEIGGLILQEKLKLKTYERAYDEARAKVYETTCLKVAQV